MSRAAHVGRKPGAMAAKYSAEALSWPRNAVSRFLGTPCKKPIAPPSVRFKNASTFRRKTGSVDFTAGRRYSIGSLTEHFENDDIDSWAAGSFYDLAGFDVDDY